MKNRDGNILNWMKTANEHFYYAHSRSVLMNGLAGETVIAETVYWWQPTLIALCALLGVLSVASGAAYLWRTMRKEEGR